MTSQRDLTGADAVRQLTVVDSGVDRAVQAADAAARAAGVTVREIGSLGEAEDVVRLYASIWGRADNPPMTLELLRAFSKAGSYVAGAYDGERLVGGCVGFFHAPAENALHSHIAGVAQGMTGRNVGFALKLHQRAWALLRGVSDIAWTFDPLIGRNAYFNLAKLAADAVEYLPNFYGAMVDSINGNDDTDRVLVRWRLRDPVWSRPVTAGATDLTVPDEIAASATVGLYVDENGGPLIGGLEGPVVHVGVPDDIAAPSRRVTLPLLRAGGLPCVRC